MSTKTQMQMRNPGEIIREDCAYTAKFDRYREILGRHT